ncbi:hypothetical protein [Nocardioides jensenii]|uniref:hypothetical protein n=1 Tax=Nocardioides jensenii TaxID=1843 RepID=UPI0008347F87|nr:hypothetical protein [Nocardioides jensenii]
MKVYLAAPYAARATIATYAEELERIGFTIISSWLEETHDINPGTTDAATSLDDDTVAGHARDDLADIVSSDLLVLFTGKAVGIPDAGSGGRHVETGYFMALHGQAHVIIVGEPENIFHRLNGVTRVPDWHEAVIELSARLVHDRSNQAMAEVDR